MNNYVDFGFGRLQFDTFLSGHVLDLHSKTTIDGVCRSGTYGFQKY